MDERQLDHHRFCCHAECIGDGYLSSDRFHHLIREYLPGYSFGDRFIQPIGGVRQMVLEAFETVNGSAQAAS